MTTESEVLKVRWLCEHHLIAHPECVNATEVDPRECLYRDKSPCRPSFHLPEKNITLNCDICGTPFDEDICSVCYPPKADGNNPPGAHVSDRKRDQWLDRHE